MKCTDYLPCKILRPFIKTLRFIESETEVINRVLPMTSLALSFRCNGEINYVSDSTNNSLPQTTISGLRKTVRLINYQKKTSAIIVLFQETGASAFSKVPVYELFELTTSLDNFFNQTEVSEVENRLFETNAIENKIAIIETFLLSKLIVPKVDEIVISAINQIKFANGNIGINALSDSLCLSKDAIEKRFRKVVGTTPKKYSTIIKLSSIIKKEKVNLIDSVFERGYYDLPHFNKDFKLFTGQNPTEFYKNPIFW